MAYIRYGSKHDQAKAIALFLGKEKPKDANEFLEGFIQEYETLQRLGIHHEGRIYKVVIKSFVCDTPARAFVKRIKSHSGYSSCEKCTPEGVYDGKMTFPETNAPLRTDESFEKQEDMAHHIRESPLSKIVSMVSCFPIDYMHLVCLGVMRRLLILLMKGPLTIRLGLQVQTEISSALIQLAKHIPREFSRKPRSLSELDRWKATEFRLFLVYTGMVVLKGKVAGEIYNFLLLSVGVSILLNPVLCKSLTDCAHQLLVHFVQHFSQIYGTNQVAYNVHNLVHLAEDVKLHGPLDAISAFPYENFLKSLKRLVRKRTLPLEQIILRLREQSNFANMREESSADGKLSVKGKHSNGPLPTRTLLEICSQHNEVIMRAFCITTNTGNNCVAIKSKICLVRNILDCKHGLFIVYQVFRVNKPFSTYPLDETRLQINEVSSLENSLGVDSVHVIQMKCVLLPYRNAHVAIPVLHTNLTKDYSRCF